MKKRNLLLSLVLTIILPMAMFGQRTMTDTQTIVINNGEGTSSYTPFFSYYANQQYVKSQFIIPSTELAEIVDKQITKLTFHTGTSYITASFPGGVFKVYLSPTDLTEFASNTPVEWTSLTEIYSGSLSVSNHMMELTLSTPYLYQGGNLLVGVEETTLSTSANFVEWIGTATENNTSYYYAGFNYREKFLPKMTVSYSSISCHTPGGLNISSTYNSATLTWTAGGEETQWKVQYKASSSSEWSDVIVVEDNPTYTINELSATTDYQVRVQAACSLSDVSSWLTDSFTTACPPESLPYSYNFNADESGQNAPFPQCWTRVNDSESSSFNYYPFVTTISSNNVLRFIASADANAPTNQIAVLPEIDADINTLRMSFKAWISSNLTNKKLTVGVMTDPYDASTFTKVTDVLVKNNSSSMVYPISLETYTGSGRYIAIKCDKIESGSFYTINVDDIYVETIPTMPLINLQNEPWSCGFEDATSGIGAFPPLGWHFSGSGYPYVYEENGYAHTGSKSLIIRKDAVTSYAALPGIDTDVTPINTLQIKFWARTRNSTIYPMYLYVGVMTDPNDISTFESMGYVNLKYAYNFYEIFLDECTNNGKYIAFQCYENDNYFLIDDIDVSIAPTCLPPHNLSGYSTGPHEANIRWETRDEDQLDFQVSYSTTESFNPSEGTVVDVHYDEPLSGTMYRDYTLACLDANTTYYFYVRANCGGGDFSTWSENYGSITTAEPCPGPYYINAEPKNTLVDFTWYGDENDEWQFQYKLSSEEEWITPGDFEVSTGESSELKYRLRGLTKATDYDARVRRHCGMYSCPVVDDGYSEWTTTSFTTSSDCWEGSAWLCSSHLGTRATLQWHNDSEETRWQIRYRLSTELEYPEENIVLTEVLPEGNPQKYTITGLQTNSVYYWQVRGYCSDTEQSEWSNEEWFVTRSTDGYITVDKEHDYYEDFEDGMPSDWSSMNLLNYDMNHYDTWHYMEGESYSWEHYEASKCISSRRELMSQNSNGSMILMPAIHIDENATSAVLSYWSKDDYEASGSRGTKNIWVSDDYASDDYTAFDLGNVYSVENKYGFWKQYFINLDDCIGKTVIIAFDYVVTYNYNNYDWLIDDVRVQVFDKVGGGDSNVISGSWDNGEFWGGSVPNSDDNVFINANVNIPSNITAQANKIVINTDTTYAIGSKAEKFGKIIIEDGGQLLTNTPVDVTVEKPVTSWNTAAKTGWYAIASPVYNQTFEDVEELVSSSYEHNIYRYDEPTHVWQEYRNDNNPFTSFENGRGYLYRTSLEGNIGYTGTINHGTVEVPITFNSTDTKLKGFNLIGNPYPHIIYKGANDAAIPNGVLLEDKYCVLGANGEWTLTDDGTTITPGTAILVQAKANGTLYIDDVSTGAASKSDNDNIWFTVRNNEFEDVACAEFKEGRGFNKMAHYNEEVPMLYIKHKGENFASVDMDSNTKVIDLCFKANVIGKYTLRLNAKGNFSYLHLVDKLTGNDIDMLIEDEYSFFGTTNDNTDRFIIRLSYSDDNNFDDDCFVYQNDNELIVNGEGELQVFDVMGRMVTSQHINGMNIVQKPDETGVYIFRLNGKTQKIVVR